MGVSTDGQLSYGVKIDDEGTLPWRHTQYHYDIADWWRAVNGYQRPFEVYDAVGNYLPGFVSGDPRLVAYYEHRFAWEKAHPLPIELVKHCSDDYPEYIIALPGATFEAARGYPQRIELADLPTRVTPEQVQALLAFCEQYGIAYAGEPGWWLSSYWG